MRPIKHRKLYIHRTFQASEDVSSALDDVTAVSGLGVGDTICTALREYCQTNYPVIARRHNLAAASGRG